MEWPEITKDTPIEEVMRIHRRIWDYVIEHGEKPVTPYASDCAFCQYYEAHFDEYITNCNDVCLGDWGEGLWCMTSIYGMWLCTGDEIEYKELAKQIRDIKLKEEYQNGRSEDSIRSGELSE